MTLGYHLITGESAFLAYSINGMMYDDDFQTDTPFGVKQGDVLPPSLFSLHINDLAFSRILI